MADKEWPRRRLTAGLVIRYWYRFIGQSHILIFPSFRKKRARSSSLTTGLVAFVRSVQAGSFAQAGRLIGVTPSAVSKNLGRLEHRLGLQLLLRSTLSLISPRKKKPITGAWCLVGRDRRSREHNECVSRFVLL
ncbi:LysR family transcriptional regulator [Novosphingobium lubricantis]